MCAVENRQLTGTLVISFSIKLISDALNDLLEVLVVGVE